MIIKKYFSILLLFSSLLFSKENEKVTLYLDWVNQFQFAGYYIAKEKGFYKELNIDIDIKEYTHNLDITKEVITNKATYGIRKSSLIVDKFNGNNIVLLSTIFQNSPLVLITLKDSNIKSPKDLKNKEIMITDDAKDSASIRAMITSQGLNQNQIKFINHSFDLNDLINKNTDAMACYLSNEPFILENKNIEFNIINPQDYSFDFYEGILFTSEDEIKDNPTRAQDMRNASLKGWEYAFNNIEESAKIIFEKYNTQNKSLESLIYEGEVLKKLAKFDEKLLGNISIEKIDNLKKFYTILGINEKNSSFKTETIIFDEKNIILSKDEQEYLKNNHFTLMFTDDKIPYSFKIGNEIKGFEIDFWDLISKKLSKPFNLEETIKNKTLNIFSDAIKINFNYTNQIELNKDFIHSNSIAQIPIAIATNEDVNYIDDISNLKHKKIAVLNTLGIIKELKNKYPNIEFIEIHDLNSAIYKIKNKEIFAYIDDLYTLTNEINKNKIFKLKVNSKIDYTLNIYLQTNKENKIFIDILNKVISSISKEEKDFILNNYQQIIYKSQIDYIDIMKFVGPLIILLFVFLFFNIRLKKEIKRREYVEKELSKLANIDALTDIYNRRKIEEIYEYELTKCKRYSRNFSLIFFDVNDFKIINDILGHHIGDDVLVKISNTIKNNIRSTDSFGRWGGDEFLIILPETNIEQAKNLINQLEKKLQNTNFELKENFKVTCSFGYAQYKEGDCLDSLIKRADESMYDIKAKYKKSKVSNI